MKNLKNIDKNISVYHFTKKENIESIFQNGLIHGTNYNTLGSPLRKGANYFWLSPAHDLMGYKGNDEYICLKVTIDTDFCIIGNIDLISSAFYNYVMEKQGRPLYNYSTLVKLFDTTAVSYSSYKIGHFRAPEVIVQHEISPEHIEIATFSEGFDSFADNYKVYYDNLKSKLSTLTNNSFSDLRSLVHELEESSKIKMVALHDDSFGMLNSYIISDTNEFFTVEQNYHK